MFHVESAQVHGLRHHRGVRPGIITFHLGIRPHT